MVGLVWSVHRLHGQVSWQAVTSDSTLWDGQGDGPWAFGLLHGSRAVWTFLIMLRIEHIISGSRSKEEGNLTPPLDKGVPGPGTEKHGVGHTVMVPCGKHSTPRSATPWPSFHPVSCL